MSYKIKKFFNKMATRNHEEWQYLDLLSEVLEKGFRHEDRTGTGTRRLIAKTMRFDLSNGNIPVFTTKKIHWKSVLVELLWFMRGDTDVKWLQSRGVNIWNSWTDKYGTIGKGYGYQWRSQSETMLVERKDSDFLCENSPVGKVCGIAEGGDRGKDKYTKDVYRVWHGMISRCYNKKDTGYRFYGQKGTKVCDRWLYFKNFLEDFKKIPGFKFKTVDWGEYSLDKDFFGSNVYAPDTCIFSSKRNQNLNTERSSVVKVTFPCGKVSIESNLVDFCKVHKLDYSQARRCVRGENSKHKDFSFEKIEVGENTLVRTNVVDQLKYVVNSLKYNPGSRRIILNAWNPLDLDKMELPPCHMMFQVSVINGKLHLELYQRSCDLFLGVPFNCSSYSVLAHILAKECGLEAKEFIWHGHDCHIYENHEAQVKEQLKRKPKPFPSMDVQLKPGDLMNFLDHKVDDMTWEDIQKIFLIENYQFHPVIKAKVAV